MRDVALMPQPHIFKRCLRVGAHHARQSADLLAGNGIALVRHCRRAFLFLAEIFFGFADFCPLQMSYLSGDLVQRWSDRRQRGHVVCMAVPLDNLRGDGCGFQPQALTYLFFKLRLQMGKCSYRARKFSHAHLFRGSLEALNVADSLGVPVCQL